MSHAATARPPSAELPQGRSAIPLRLDRFDWLFLAVLLIEFAGVSLLPFAAKPFGDLNFYAEAKTLAGAIRGGAPWSEVAVTRGPGPVVYYTIPFLAVPPGSGDQVYWWAGFAWNVWWMAVALLCLRRAAAALGGRVAGIAAGALVLASPFSVYYSFGISAETPAYLGAAVLAYGWASGAMSRDRSSSHGDVPWLAAVGLSLLLLSRPNAALILPLLGLNAWLLWRNPSAQARGDARGLWWTMILAFAVTLVAAAAVRAAARAPAGSPQLDNLSQVMFQGRFQYRTEPFDWRYWDNETRRGSADHSAWLWTRDSLTRKASTTRTPVSALRWRWVWTDLRDHPGVTIQSAAVRFLTLNLAFVNSTSPDAFRLGPISGYLSYWAFHLAVNLSWLAILALCVLHALRHPGTLSSYSPLWGPWVALLVFHLFTYAEPRYLFPGQPGLVVMATAMLSPFLARRKSRAS